MTANQILRMLRSNDFDMNSVVEVARNYVEIFNGDPLEYDENLKLARDAAKILKFSHIVNIAYGGWMVSNEPFNIDSENCL